MQLCLILFVVGVSIAGGCKHVLKKSIPLYLFLLVFLYVVNFFFLKSPGFFTNNYLYEHKDILGYNSVASRTTDSLHHSWFFGGRVLTGKDGNEMLFDNKKCLETVLGWLKGKEACSDGEHNHVAESTVSSKWQIFKLMSGGGTFKYAAFLPAWYTVSWFQILNAVGLANKIILIIILSSVFSFTSSFPSFAYAIEDLMRPLKYLKLPSRVMALAIAISIRFAPSLISEAFRIIRAQASRGIDYKNGKLRDKASALLSLFVPLFVISFLKSKELAEAMKARGYEHTQSRTSFRTHIVTGWELIVFSLSVFFVASLYYCFFSGYYFGIFGSSEYLLMLAT